MDSRFWDERYATTELIWTAEANRFLVEVANELTPGRALDLACGEGRNTVWLAEQGWEATGADFSPIGLAKAAKLAESRGVSVNLMVADATIWRPKIQGFDLVAVLYLQLPSPQREIALRSAIEAVAPGGTFLVVAHDVLNITDGVGGPQDPSVCYSADGVNDLLGGFEIIESGVRTRPVKTPEGAKDALDTVVVARKPPHDA